MDRRVLVTASICLLALLTYFQFPGHTYLQSDTQIYIPILENLWDRTVLANDLIVQHPHVSFTLYDEVALALRKLTGAPFREILSVQQIVYRALGIWGLYLAAESLGLSATLALLVTGIVSLGATISGPAVLTFEYEPVPRGFAVPLLFLGIGLTAQGRWITAGIAGAVAFLMHPPTAYPFWLVYLLIAAWPAKPYVMRARLYAFIPLIAALVVLWIASQMQGGATQAQMFFARLDPAQERLQRMRASYNWVSIWIENWLPHYLALYAATLAATRRLWTVASIPMRCLAVGLPAIGLLSLPLSYLSLEKMRWALIPQFQPMRAVLFITAMAMFLGAAAACEAARKNRYWEAGLWFALVYLIPVNNKVWQIPSVNRVALVLLLSALACVTCLLEVRRHYWAGLTAAAVVTSAFFVIPALGKVSNYPSIHNADLDRLAAWARASTPEESVFLFPDAKQELAPGIFRAEALRAVHVDWKGGGQVNYFKDLGEEWWRRWAILMTTPFRSGDPGEYARLGIDYIVLKSEHRLGGQVPVFENARFAVYPTRR